MEAKKIWVQGADMGETFDRNESVMVEEVENME